MFFLTVDHHCCICSLLGRICSFHPLHIIKCLCSQYTTTVAFDPCSGEKGFYYSIRYVYYNAFASNILPLTRSILVGGGYCSFHPLRKYNAHVSSIPPLSRSVLVEGRGFIPPPPCNTTPLLTVYHCRVRSLLVGGVSFRSLSVI